MFFNHSGDLPMGVDLDFNVFILKMRDFQFRPVIHFTVRI